MKVVAQNVKVEFTNEEEKILVQAGKLLKDLINTIEGSNFGVVYIKDLAREYDIENLEDAKSLLFDLTNGILELE